jgi:uncharacterized protein (TIGR00369 family)
MLLVTAREPVRAVHGGIADTLPDSVVGCAVHTSLPAGVGYTALEVKVIYVRAVQTNGETLTAAGTVLRAGPPRRNGGGKVVDGRGKLVAHATTTCPILDGAG